MRKILYLLLFGIVFSCQGDYGEPDTQRLVVEAWIDKGGFPMVFVTRSIPVTSEYQSIDDLGQYLERWAKVTIDNGSQQDVMVGRLNRHYYPPFYYTTSFMRGETGKTYHLHVETQDGLTADATTTLQDGDVAIDSFWVTPVATSDTLYQLHAQLDMSVCNSQYYKLFTQTNTELQTTVSTMLGTFSLDMIEQGHIIINQGRTNVNKDYITSFSVNDTVHVRIAALTEEQYDYWRNFEDALSLSRNPLFPVTNNLPGNVRDGIGYWFAYNARSYDIVIRKLADR